MNKVHVYIGRFQIPHVGHESVIRHGLENSEHLIILVGSSNSIRTTKNPFLFEERKEMIKSITNRIDKNKKVSILSLSDFPTDEEWTEEVKRLVYSVAKENDIISLTGCKKTGDESTYYLNIFPEWKKDFIFEINFKDVEVISSTKAREFFYKGNYMPEIVSPEVRKYLLDFKIKKEKIFEELITQFNTKKLKI